MIRRVQNEFIAVSVAAADMHRPASGIENQLLQRIGESGPAPQGIAVLNTDGQVLDWVLTFRDDPAVIEFLDHTLKRFGENPDSSKPFATERYQQFPGQPSDPVPAHNFKVSDNARHGSDDHCPASDVYLPGTMIARVSGRRLNADGSVLSGEINQEDYSQDKFLIEPALQEAFATALDQAGSGTVPIPVEIAERWTAYAYMGMLDVRPLDNPMGLKTERKMVEFTALADSERPAWFRLQGRTDVVVGDPVKGEGRMKMGNSVQLEWRGYAKLEDRRLTSLVLVAEGEESLRWGAGRPEGMNLGAARPPEVSSLLGGRPIQWSGPVRFGIIGEPAGEEQTSTTAGSGVVDHHSELQTKMPRLRQYLQNGGERTRQIVAPLMPEFQEMVRAKKFEEASKRLDEILKLIEAPTDPAAPITPK